MLRGGDKNFIPISCDFEFCVIVSKVMLLSYQHYSSKDSSVKKKVRRKVDFSNLRLEIYHLLIRKLKQVIQNTYTWILHDFHFFDMKSSKFIKSASGTGAKLILFLKFWCHIFAPTSRRSARIALKTS